MATGKRYYWIKLKEAFMTSDAVDFLMGQPDGANYVVLYQMLCFYFLPCKSLIVPYPLPAGALSLIFHRDSFLFPLLRTDTIITDAWKSAYRPAPYVHVFIIDSGTSDGPSKQVLSCPFPDFPYN